MAILHWKQAKDVEGTYEQLAWHNTVDVKIPVTVSPADHDRDAAEVGRAISKVLRSKRTTGVYGTDYTLKVINFPQGFILVKASTYIGD
jgi:hypothetical protein